MRQNPGRRRSTARRVARYDGGGSIAPEAGAAGIAPPAYLGASPMVQLYYQRFAGLPLDKLQQLASMVPQGSLPGQMIQRALRAKEIAPASTGAFSPSAIAPPAGSAPGVGFPLALQQSARGGALPRRDSGGLVANAGAPAGTAAGFGHVMPTSLPGASTPEGGFGRGSTEPWLQKQAQLQQQGLNPQQIFQTLSNWTPSNARTPPVDPIGMTRPAGLTPGIIGARSSVPSAPAPPAASSFAGALPGFGGFGRYGRFGFPFASGFYGGSGYGGAAFARPMLPTMSFSAGNPGQIGPSWSPGETLLNSQPLTPLKGAPAGGIGYWTNPATGAGYMEQPNGQWTDYNGAAVPAGTIPVSAGGPTSGAPTVTPLPASVLSPSAAAAAPAPAANAMSGYFNSVTDPATGAPISASRVSQLAQMGYSPQEIIEYGQNPALAAAEVAGYDKGGAATDSAPSAPAPPVRRERYHPGGFLPSRVAGRTDQLPLAVPIDSHVIPADVVSGTGEGNSLNGAGLLDRLFHHGPWGQRAAKTGSAGRASPALDAAEPTTSILAAGGEYVVRPEAVARLGEAAKRLEPQRHRGKSDTDAGHDVIDDFILDARKHAIAATRKLPGPAKR
jgi:hypothetical protein